jgi:hypothetical protein
MNYKKYIVSSLALFLGVSFLGFGISTAHAAPFTLLGSSDLTIASTGQNVVQLQGLLSELGYLNVPQGIPFGYFGPLTQEAVGRFQQSLGVTPSVGYYGIKTRLSMATYLEAKGWLRLLASSF